MPSFQKNPFLTPWGTNEYLRSTDYRPPLSRTCAAGSVPWQTVDGSQIKTLPKGVVMAKITSGEDAGKVGPYQDAGTVEVQTLTESGTISGGTWDILTLLGVEVDLDDIAFDVTAAALQALIRGAVEEIDPDIDTTAITVTGGPVATTPFTINFGDSLGNVAPITVDATGLTGTTPGITVATATPGVGGATDGRQTVANVVGLNNTLLPWQLSHRDVEIAVMYDAAVVLEKCLKLNAAGEYVPLDATTDATLIAAMVGKSHIDIRFVN